MRFITSIERKLESLEIIINKRVLGSILIALSGLLLYLDKVLLFLKIEGGNDYGFYDYYTFVWTLMQSVVPVIIILGVAFRPYLSSFLVPIYSYTVQITWIFQPEIRFDNVLLHLYAIGSCSLFLILTLLINKISIWHKKQEILKDEFQQETKEILNILKSKTLSES